MKNHILILIFLISLGCNRQQDDKVLPFSTDQYRLFEKYASVFPDSTELSIALINDNDVMYIGFVKLGDTLMAINNKNSAFEIGSITKIFTSTLLAKLITDSTINLDDPIEKYLPYSLNQSGYNNSAITFKTLANHTSGFPRMPENYPDIVKDSPDGSLYNTMVLDEYLNKNLILGSNPGNEYLYSNLGYATLGHLIEIVQKSDYEELLQNSICTKYGMHSTTTKFEKIKDKIVVGRDSSGHGIPYSDLGVFRATGGIMSTVVDLTKFVQANFTHDDLLDYQRAETYRWGNFGIALGWQITYIGGENCKWYNHNGGMDGYRSSLFFDIPTKTAAIVLSDLSVYHPENDNIDKLAFDLMKSKYLTNNANGPCSCSFIEKALNMGWGSQIRDSLIQNDPLNNTITGVWYQNNNNRIITRTFTPDNKVQTDFYKDKEIDVWGFYELNGNQIKFNDIGGLACNEEGTYEFEITGDTLRFKEIMDKCDGRKTGLLKDWIRMKKQ